MPKHGDELSPEEAQRRFEAAVAQVREGFQKRPFGSEGSFAFCAER